MAVAWELVPGRGSREKLQEDALMAAEQAAKGGRIDAVTITDNPGGNPAILADDLGREILKLGVEPWCISPARTGTAIRLKVSSMRWTGGRYGICW